MDFVIAKENRFYVEAAVGLAKSSVFLASSEDEVRRGEFIMATISAYYSVFHLSLVLIWLFTDLLPPKMLSGLIELREKGNELPSSDITHNNIQKFLCDGQLKIENAKLLCKLFCRAQVLREFGNYGPRVTWSGSNPIVGPCDITIDHLKSLVNEIRPAFTEIVQMAAKETGLFGALSPIVLDHSIDLMNRAEFPFLNWVSPQIHKEALELLQNINAEVLKIK